jgi:hypothetical protein
MTHGAMPPVVELLLDEVDADDSSPVPGLAPGFAAVTVTDEEPARL